MPEAPQFYLSQPHDCSYLPGRLARLRFFQSPSLGETVYENLLGLNFRRSGLTFYRPECDACSLCIQMRVPVADFRPSHSQARSLRKNRDLHVHVDAEIDREDALNLYADYIVARHNAAERPQISEVRDFLGVSPVRTVLMRYILPSENDRLVGAGWVDVLENGTSSVYFAFDERESRRSLGVFSLLREIELAKELGKDFVYLGYFVPGSPAMEYKADYRPFEALVRGNWKRYESTEEILREIGDKNLVRPTGSAE